MVIVIIKQEMFVCSGGSWLKLILNLILLFKWNTFQVFFLVISSVPVVQLCPKLKQEEKKTTELCPELCSFNFIISSVELILY